MSDSARPDREALEELRRLLQLLGEEMGALRRRAQQAEARVRELEDSEAQLVLGDGRGLGHRGDAAVQELARENEMLRARLDTARQRTRALLDRMRFLRQQHEAGAER